MQNSKEKKNKHSEKSSLKNFFFRRLVGIHASRDRIFATCI
jgi:hypothetical protein